MSDAKEVAAAAERYRTNNYADWETECVPTRWSPHKEADEVMLIAAYLADLATRAAERAAVKELIRTVKSLIKAAPEPSMSQHSFDEPPEYSTAEDYHWAMEISETSQALANHALAPFREETDRE